MSHRKSLATLVAALAVLGGGVAGAGAAMPAMMGGMSLGTMSSTSMHRYTGWYDSHKDTFLLLSASTKPAATALRVTYAPGLAGIKGAPPIYIFSGAGASGQAPVFGLTEPGKAGYTPIWEELVVKWKAGVTPTPFVLDDDITAAAKAGKLTITDAHVLIDAPIVTVGK